MNIAPPKTNRRRRIEGGSGAPPTRLIVIAIALIVVCTTLWIMIGNLGMVQIIGLDQGITINVGWEMHLGYRPYAELVSGFPPLYLFGIGAAFKLWGVTWAAAVNITALFALLALCLHFWLIVQLGVEWYFALAIAATVQCVAFVPISFWWYNQPSSVAAALFITAAMGYVMRPGSTVSVIGLVITGALLALSKLNDCGMGFGAAALIILTLGPSRKRFMLILLAAILLAVAIMFLGQVDFQEFVRCCYSAVVGRAHTLKHKGIEWDSTTMQITTVTAMALLLVSTGLLFSQGWRFARTDLTLLLLALSGVATSFIAVYTNREDISGDLAPALTSIGLFIFLRKKYPARNMQRIGIGIKLATALTFITLTFEAGHIGIERSTSIADLIRDETPTLSQHLAGGGMLEGMLVNQRALSDINELGGLVTHLKMIKPNITIYLGPRLDFAYAELGLRPPPSVPIIWEGFEDEMFSTAAMNGKIDVFIFRTYMSLDKLWIEDVFVPHRIHAMLEKDYVRQDTDQLVYFVRRDEVEAGPGTSRLPAASK